MVLDYIHHPRQLKEYQHLFFFFMQGHMRARTPDGKCGARDAPPRTANRTLIYHMCGLFIFYYFLAFSSLSHAVSQVCVRSIHDKSKSMCVI